MVNDRAGRGLSAGRGRSLESMLTRTAAVYIARTHQTGKGKRAFGIGHLRRNMATTLEDHGASGFHLDIWCRVVGS